MERMLRDGKRKRYAFSAAEDDIYYLMERDAYPRFVRSDFYKDLLKSAQQPVSLLTHYLEIFPEKFTVSANKRICSQSLNLAFPQRRILERLLTAFF